MKGCGSCDEGKIECDHCGGTGLEPPEDGTDLGSWIQAVADAVHDTVLGADDCSKCNGDKVIDCPDCGYSSDGSDDSEDD